MKRLFAPFLILVVVLVFGMLWYKEGLLPVDATDQTPKIFVIAPGASIKTIARNLENDKLIRSRLAFYLLVKIKGIEKKIQYGDFRLTRQMSVNEIASELTHGTLDVWVTVIEGMRVEEIARLLSQQLDIPESVFISIASKREGYLFPDTYLIPIGATAEQVLSTLEQNFNNKVDDKVRQSLSRAGFSLSEGVILASLLEREAQSYADKQMVAGILVNRLEIDMALQIDATVQYALGYSAGQQSWWKRHLTEADLKIDSPYNTYLYPGLPPRPIANPGLESILAVAKPKKSNYFYYLTDNQGKMHYSETLEEHNQKIVQYLD